MYEEKKKKRAEEFMEMVGRMRSEREVWELLSRNRKRRRGVK